MHEGKSSVVRFTIKNDRCNSWNCPPQAEQEKRSGEKKISSGIDGDVRNFQGYLHRQSHYHEFSMGYTFPSYGDCTYGDIRLRTSKIHSPNEVASFKPQHSSKFGFKTTLVRFWSHFMKNNLIGFYLQNLCLPGLRSQAAPRTTREKQISSHTHPKIITLSCDQCSLYIQI